nr:hypothetical protein B0A51_12455 [Rachicladosporium sp. CCFEE 5018]
MPAKSDDNTNLRFMHACLLASDYTRIDFNEVSAKFGIQAPAARKRFARLHTGLGGKTKTRKRLNSVVARGSKAGASAKGESGMSGKGSFGGGPAEDDDEIVVARKVERASIGIKKEEPDGDEGAMTSQDQWFGGFVAPSVIGGGPGYYGPPCGMVPPHLRQPDVAAMQAPYFVGGFQGDAKPAAPSV